MSNEMPLSPEAFLKQLDDAGVEYDLHHHQAVFSVGEADELDAQLGGTHTRNLFIRDKKETMFLVTLMARKKIDLKKLSDLLGAGRFSFGSPERLMANLGVTPGSVTPFSKINDKEHKVALILDKEMMETEICNFHPLINTMTVGIKPKDLLRFLDISGHKYEIKDLAPALAEEA